MLKANMNFYKNTSICKYNKFLNFIINNIIFPKSS